MGQEMENVKWNTENGSNLRVLQLPKAKNMLEIIE